MRPHYSSPFAASVVMRRRLQTASPRNGQVETNDGRPGHPTTESEPPRPDTPHESRTRHQRFDGPDRAEKHVKLHRLRRRTAKQHAVSRRGTVRSRSGKSGKWIKGK